jgi:hypothetical protein
LKWLFEKIYFQIRDHFFADPFLDVFRFNEQTNQNWSILAMGKNSVGLFLDKIWPKNI